MRVTCDSGLKGWQCPLKNNYADFDEFEYYSEIYGLHTRLGFKTPSEAWEANPLIEGSVIPEDFRVVEN